MKAKQHIGQASDVRSVSSRRAEAGAVGRVLSRALALVNLIAMAAFLAACGTPGKNLSVTEGSAVPGTDGVQELAVRVESFYFEPSLIHVVVNTPVRLTLKSGTFLIPHNFSLHAPDAGIDISQDVGHGKTVVVEFTPTKVGQYPFHCAKGSHAEKGMVGTLVVEAKR